MRKVLLVGLGGSGGKTLAFLMDELLADLKERRSDSGERWTKDRLPACWSFVHIDVPHVEGDLGRGLAKPVSQQGGKYLGLSDPMPLYNTYDSYAHSKFKSSGPESQGLRSFARWRPNPPAASVVPISRGAGAYRAIGRVVTLAKADIIHSTLKETVRKLFEAETDREGVEVSNLLGFSYSSDAPPLVLFVSSMAGGSGASMVLDVVDILRSVSADYQGFNANEVTAFLYTADVFSSLPEVMAGAGAGTLATVSELVAAAGRSNQAWTDIEWRGISIAAPKPPATRELGRGPKMIIPVGGSSAGRAFGSSEKDVYRGFARMLMPLVNDEPSQSNHAEHTITNFAMQAGNIDGAFFAKKREDDGNWPMFFAGYGNANLTMGLDRYKEYSAQRIAREAIEILTRGHVPDGSQGGNVNTFVSNGVDKFYPTFLKVLQLEGETSGSVPFDIQRVLREALSKGDAPTQVTSEESKFYEADFMAVGETTSRAVQARLAGRQRDRLKLAQDSATKAVKNWSQDFLRNFEEALVYVISRYGLLVAEQTIQRLKQDLQSLADGLLRSANGVDQASSDIARDLKAVGEIRNRVTWLSEGERFRQSLGKLVRELVKSSASQLLSQVLSEFNSSVLPEIANKIQGLNTELLSEVQTKTEEVSKAAFREAPASQWPSSNVQPPNYFQPATNEVLLTPISQYPSQFDSHIIQWSTKGAAEGVREAASELVLRRSVGESDVTFEKIKGWAEDETLSYHPHLERAREWRPVAVSEGAVPQLPIHQLKLSAENLREYAHQWLSVVGNPFEKHCREGIRQWVLADPAREVIFANQLKLAMQYAQPLVSVDLDLVAIHQPTTNYGPRFTFSTIPLSSESSAIADVKQVFSNSVNHADNEAALKSACQPASKATSIYITTATPPVSPWALKSLKDPVRAGYAQVSENFFQWRRARPLMEFIPLGPDSIEAFLRGYLVGRLTGAVQTESVEGGPMKVKVWCPPNLNNGSTNWLYFSEDLLGPNPLGLESAGHRDTTGWNIPALLLESLPLALALTEPTDLSRINPYKALIELGLELRAYPFAAIPKKATFRTTIENWFDGSLPFKSQISACSHSGAAGVKGADTYLANVESYCDSLLAQNLDNDLTLRLPPAFEIAVPLKNAVHEVRKEINRPNLGVVEVFESESQEPALDNEQMDIAIEAPEA